jgi:ribosomal protein S18 acetylase RimI-like enzyme
MNITFRDASGEDLQLVRKFTIETAWSSFPEYDQKKLDREKWTKNFLEMYDGLLRKVTGRLFVAENEGHDFVGYVWIGEDNNMMTGLKSGFIYDIFVKEEYRGKGIGKTLLEKAESYCKEKGYSKILLMVAVNNSAAMNLYDRMGFKPEQTYMGKGLSQ